MKFSVVFLWSCAVLFMCACGKKIVDKAVTVHYVYVNTFTEQVQLSLRIKSNSNFKHDFLIKGRDSIILSETDMVIPGPFSSFSADSVIISFSNKRQVSYSRNSNLSGPDLGTGVFNLENYKGYQKLQSLASSNLYRLVYEIDARDYEKTNPE